MKTTLTNEQLIDKSFEWVKKLAETKGGAWTLRVPVDFNNDPDMIFIELGNRLRVADEENKRLREMLQMTERMLLTPTPQP